MDAPGDRTGLKTRSGTSLRDLDDGVLAAVFASLRDGLVVVDPDGQMLAHNAQFAELWGFDEELLASGDDDAALERACGVVSDPRRFIERVRELYGKPEVRSLEDIEFRDGRVIERHGGPAHDARGTYIGHLWTFRDVTELRREQQAGLRRARMRLELLDRLEQGSQALDRALTPTQVLLAVLREGLAVMGADTGYLAVLDDDDANLQVWRINPASDSVEHLGEVPLDARLPIAEAARTGALLFIGSNEDLRCNHPGLTRMLAEDHACATLPLVVRGRVRAVLNIGFKEARVFDERDRELFTLLADRAAVALDRATLYRTLEHQASTSYALDHVGDGVFMVDERGVVRTWNSAAAQVLGIAAVDALGRPVGEVVPGWEKLERSIPIDEAETLGGAQRLRAPVVTPGGRETCISISGVRGPSGLVYAFRDVTDEQRLERAKSDFVATVSHELRTPVTSIMGAAITLQRQDIELEPEARDSLLDAIVSESQRLAFIASQVLLAGEVDAGQISSQVQEIDLAAVTGEAVDALLNRHKDVEVRVDMPGGGQVAALGDAERLRQVLDNLLENAVKYSPGAPPRIEVHVTRGDRHARIDVVDRGLGIPAAEHGHIFEKFYRVDAAMSKGVGGTGLGLYISRQLVRGMGGTLSVRSAGEGHGSTFSVRLPSALDSSQGAR